MKLSIMSLINNRVNLTGFIRRIEWNEMILWINPQKNEKILDVGCGTGELDMKLAKTGSYICGIDLSKDNIKLANEKADKIGLPCKFIVGNAEELPFPDEYFDKIISSSSLEHFENDVQALKDMERVLNNDGSIILTVDSFSYPIDDKLKKMHQNVAHVVNYYNEDDLRAKFEFANLNLIKSKYLLNTKLTSYFFNLGILLNFSGLTWLVISIGAYPICFISEKLFCRDDIGYTLLVKGQKQI